MQKWEVKRLWIPISLEFENDERKGFLGTGLHGVWLNPYENQATEDAWIQASQLANNGW